ncbi:hypothetical protein GCM10027447_09520 [Glycomyces halotolerans]
MKRFALISVAALALALAACGGDEGDDPDDGQVETGADTETPTEEATGPVELDLEEAGGACPLIDPAQLNEVTGRDFRFASGGAGEEAEDDAPAQATCAVQTGEAAYPDLTLFVIGTEASVEVYEEELPDGVESVDDLGESAYWIVHTEDTGAGPALEMGWYDGGDIFEMRYTTPEGTEPAEVEALVPGFTELAGSINQARADAKSEE